MFQNWYPVTVFQANGIFRHRNWYCHWSNAAAFVWIRAITLTRFDKGGRRGWRGIGAIVGVFDACAVLTTSTSAADCIIGRVRYPAQPVIAYLAGIVIGVAFASNGICAKRHRLPLPFAVVCIGVPHHAGVAIGIVVAIGAAGTRPGGGDAAGCPDGSPGLGGEVGVGPAEEEQGEPIEESIRTQWHGLSPEFAWFQRFRK